MISERSSSGQYWAASRTSRIEIAILVCGAAIAIATGVVGYRISGPYGERDRDDPRVRRFVDPATGRLHLLVYDANGDGTFDTWSFMDGARTLRMEVDEDGDGRIDRWIYYRSDGTVEKIGLSTSHDGQPGIWTYPDKTQASVQDRQP